MAQARWSQISDHVSHLICQWQAIGTLLPNRVLLAKALMQSHCYYLLDGNSIPNPVLQKLSNKIMHFVCSPFSRMPYSFLEAPLASGSANCPSLISQKAAYDLKFLSDLISGPPSPLWKIWTMHDLHVFSPSSQHLDNLHLLQKAYTRPTQLNNHLSSTFLAAQHISLDLRTCFPSLLACLHQQILYHPAVPYRFMWETSCLASHSIKLVKHLY